MYFCPAYAQLRNKHLPQYTDNNNFQVLVANQLNSAVCYGQIFIKSEPTGQKRHIHFRYSMGSVHQVLRGPQKIFAVCRV